MENNFNKNLIKIFSESELYTNKISNKNDKMVLYKCHLYNDNLYFLLFDYFSLYYCSQNLEEVNKLNKELNSSIEFESVQILINFLINNLFKAEKGLIITHENLIDENKENLKFEILVDIIKVKWNFVCEKIVTVKYYLIDI
jgi:hypothetical protein